MSQELKRPTMADGSDEPMAKKKAMSPSNEASSNDREERIKNLEAKWVAVCEEESAKTGRKVKDFTEPVDELDAIYEEFIAIYGDDPFEEPSEPSPSQSYYDYSDSTPQKVDDDKKLASKPHVGVDYTGPSGSPLVEDDAHSVEQSTNDSFDIYDYKPQINPPLTPPPVAIPLAAILPPTPPPVAIPLAAILPPTPPPVAIPLAAILPAAIPSAAIPAAAILPAAIPAAAILPAAIPAAAILPAAIPAAAIPSAAILSAAIPSAPIPSAAIPSAAIPSAAIPSAPAAIASAPSAIAENNETYPPTYYSYTDEDGTLIYYCPECFLGEDVGTCMIMCDFCYGWFHMECVNLTDIPDTEKWYCYICSESRKLRGTRNLASN